MGRPGLRVPGGTRKTARFGLVAVVATAVALTAAGPAAAAVEAEGVIREAGSAQVAPDRYIVVLKDTVVRAQGVDQPVRDLSSKFGGKVARTYRKTVRGFAVKNMTETQARRLAADPAVAYVQKDGIVRVSGNQSSLVGWNLDRIDSRTGTDGVYRYPMTGSNVHAYIIDTGIRITHFDFGGRASYGYDFVDSDPVADDCYGHGTHVAGIVGGGTRGVAKGVQLVAVRVLGCDGSGYTSDVIAGIDWVTANAIKPAVANMSLGGDADPTEDAAVQQSIASGVAYTVAAGNGDANGVPQDACTTSPARVPEAITVGATDINDQRASWSNYGTCLDIFAPGVSIVSAWYTNDGAEQNESGTSMAAPHVAGAAALVLSANPGFTPAQVRDALVNDATPNVVGDPGAGSPNKFLFVSQPTVVSAPATLYNPRFGTTETYARTSANHVVYKYYSGGWSDWFDLGGDAAGDPAVLYNPQFGTTEVYVRTNRNRVAYRYYYNGWSPWMDLGRDALSNPAVVYNPRFGRTDLYVRTSANTVAYRFYYNGWSDWFDLGGSAAGDPAAVYNPRFGTTEVYSRMSGNTVAYQYYLNQWSGWIPLDGDVGSNPAVLYNPRFGTTEVYVRTSANHVAYRYYYNGWSGWNDLGGPATGDPAVLYNPRFGTTEVYSRTDTNTVAYRYFLNGWSGWNDIGGSMATDPALLYNPNSGTTEAYAISGGSIWEQYYANGWSGWKDIVTF